MKQPILPQHVAIIMDGNGRWAKQRHLPRVAGHKAGLDAARKVVEHCVNKKIEVLTLFVFSSENWQRPREEVNYLMDLFARMLQRDAKKLHEQNVQLRVIGDRSRFSHTLQKHIHNVESLTAHNKGLKLVLAVNYGGQWDITQAVKKLVNNLQSNDEITAEVIKMHLSFADLPDPDLFIRTSGEMRISNFMLWQLAYSELYFTSVYWPDFDKMELEKAFAFYASRERRFGYTGEQLKEEKHA